MIFAFPLIMAWVGSTLMAQADAKLQAQKVNYYNKGKTTANGDAFRKDSFTCAVANRSMMKAWYRFDCGGRTVYAYANDIIGPAGRKKGHKYELSEGAFRRLIPAGVDPYEIGELTVTVTRAK